MFSWEFQFFEKGTQLITTQKERGYLLDNSHKLYSFKKGGVTKTNDILKPLTFNQCHYNAKIKHYPDESCQFCVFSRPIFNPYKAEERKPIIHYTPTEHKTYNMDNTRDDSIHRTITKIKDIILANDWDCMITLTLDKEKIDRYDPKEIQKKISKWLNNVSQRKDVSYLLVPEYHLNKAIHFHGVAKKGELELIDSGKTDNNNRKQYNIKNYPYGFSSAVFLDENIMRVSNYIQKYITKDLKKIFGNYYLAGGNIKRELPCEYDNIDYCEFQGKEYEINDFIRVKYAKI